MKEVIEWDLPTIIKTNDILDFRADMQAAYTEAEKPKKKKGIV